MEVEAVKFAFTMVHLIEDAVIGVYNCGHASSSRPIHDLSDAAFRGLI